ncbi:hypothetical protein B296_00029634 [Ensete ventricosum]|uniref:Uncharacterized protein n=1 Tax=Ensete ventricosum TaxID=4639 RepID=A0A426ZCM2_ENSVE|nr:hypothetical protein B296_00029634 [Ensete ventricosum]
MPLLVLIMAIAIATQRFYVRWLHDITANGSSSSIVAATLTGCGLRQLDTEGYDSQWLRRRTCEHNHTLR